MSQQESSKQAHEFGCLKAAQESMEGFPQGEIRPGGNPPDCYVAVSDSDVVAVELTEQIDQIGVQASAHAKCFLEEARAVFFCRHPEYRTGWRVSMSPGDIFEKIAEAPNSTNARTGRKNLIEKFIVAVAREIANRHSFEWRATGEPIWTFDICERVHPEVLTEILFQYPYGYSYESRDRIENGFGRDVTFKPESIQERITRKVSGLRRYGRRPAYLLISASLFPRSVRNTGSFAVLHTPRSIVEHLFNIGDFTAVFLHDPIGRSYRIGKNGRAVELQRRLISTATSGAGWS